MKLRLPRTSRWSAFALLPVVFALASCGGSDSSEAVTAQEAAAAFEEAGNGYEFEKTTSLVDGAVAYAPRNESDPAAVEPLNEALGESSLLWQVLVFEGSEPPLEEDAAKAAAFASDSFDEADEGVFIGDNDTAYAASGNVVVTGPVLDGDPEDETLQQWKTVIDGL